MKTNFTYAMAVLAVMMFLVGCKPDPVEPTVAIEEQLVVISYNRAWLYAEIMDDGGAVVTERGFCYGEAGGKLDNLVFVEDGTDFMGELSGLNPSTVYACKAFAVNEAGCGYSNEFSFTTLNDTIPTVITNGVKEVTYHSAVVSGQVLNGGGHKITDKGICYGLSALPTVNDSCLSAGSGVGPFETHIEGLLPDIRYYYRAYAVSPEGVFYGVQQVIDTDVLPLAVRTIGVSDVTASRVRAEGEVIRDGELEVTECGFCWGTEHNPTIERLHIKASTGLGEYSCYFSGLERGQTHYVRAYAINEKGVTYGEEVEFFPDDPFGPWPGGASPGLFSVAPGHQVRFSQGNLQYNPDNDVFRFAEHQWDYVGGKGYDYLYDDMVFGNVYKDGVKCDNTLISRYYEGWIDLFGWGTSGWNNGNVYYHPYDYASSVHNYFGPVGNFDLTGEYAQSDWGVYNTISNGGSRQWRTPSVDEINYLLLERETPSGIRFVKAEVAGVRGVIVLPDDWDASVYFLKAVNMNRDYSENKITGGEWLDVLEPAGAVFLPAAGASWTYFSGINTVYYVNNSISYTFDCGGNYWTVTCVEGSVNNASMFFFYGCDDGSYYSSFIGWADRCDGKSVRLISDE